MVINILFMFIVVIWLGLLYLNGVIWEYWISVKKEEKENNI